MTNGRDFHSATLLPSGDVVIAGGNSFFSISSVELYNQTSGTFTGAGSLSTPRHFHTATLLPSGKVLFVGGVNEFSGQESPEFSVLWSAGLFDPNSTSSLFTGGLGTQRFRHAAALLNNGHRMGRDSPDSRGVTCTSLYVRNCGSQQPLHYYLNQRHHCDQHLWTRLECKKLCFPQKQRFSASMTTGTDSAVAKCCWKKTAIRF